MDAQVRGHPGRPMVGHCGLSGSINVNSSRQVEEKSFRRRRLNTQK